MLTTSLKNERELHLFVKEATLVVTEANFNLWGWEYPSL
jgi:hypothetical protein